MATFAPISYKYIPTASRSKKTDSRCKPTTKLQHVRSNSTALDAPRLPSPAVVDCNRGHRSEIQARTGTFCGSSDGDEFPTIEEILYTTLKKDGFTTTDSSPENGVEGVGEFALGKRDDSLNHSGSALGDDLGGSPGHNDLNASEAEAEEVSLRAESAAPDAGLVNSPETAVDSTILAPRSPNGWHDIDDFPETATQQEVEQGEDNANDEDEGPQQEVNDMEVTAKRVSDTYLSSKEDGSLRLADRPQFLPSDPSLSQDGVGSDSPDDDELNDTDLDDEEPRPLKRKRPSSFSDGLMYKKRKNCRPQRSTRKYNLRSKPYGRSPKSHYPLGPGSRATATPSAKGQLPSPARSTSGTMDAELLSECSSRPSRDVLPTLTEITFRSQSSHCFSFTAIVQEGYDGRGVSFSQLTQLVESIGYVGKIDDFTIKPLQQHSFLVTGLSRHKSPRLMPSSTNVLTQTKANRIRAINVAGPVTPREIGPYTSGESDSDHNSNNDDDGCLSEDEQDRPSTRKKIPWDPLDEQRLQAYMKENKSWSWIFKSFPQRTRGAVRTRWSMIQPRG